VIVVALLVVWTGLELYAIEYNAGPLAQEKQPAATVANAAPISLRRLVRDLDEDEHNSYRSEKSGVESRGSDADVSQW